MLSFTLAILALTALLLSGEGNVPTAVHLGDEAQMHHH